MTDSKFPLILIILVLVPGFLFAGCEKTIDEEVVRPIEAMHGQKEVASIETAMANVQAVRSALMRYPATSTENLYPSEMDITGYDSLREVLADAGLPGNMADLMWDPFYGIRYASDGYTFTFQVKAAGNGKVVTATPSGVEVEE